MSQFKKIQARHPTDILRAAIDSLDNFSRQNKNAPIPNIQNLEFKEGKLDSHPGNSLRKMMDLTRCFIFASFSDRMRENQNKKRSIIHKELVRAIDVVKTHYRLIEKLKKGDEVQRKFAEQSLEVINQFNNLINQSIEIPRSWSSRVAKFLYEKSGLSLGRVVEKLIIDLPQKIAVESRSSVEEISAPALNSSKKILSFIVAKDIQSQVFPSAVTYQEIDAFRMKAITMIKQHAIHLPIQEAMNSILESPIQAKMDQEDRQNQSIISFKQVLNPFPGEIIEVEGAFERQGHSFKLSIPKPGSFRIFSTSIQTGFPYPLQYIGWALTDQLIPLCPLRLNELNLFKPLYLKKKEVAHALLPKGKLIEKAKRILEGKKKAFLTNKEFFTENHRLLCQEINRSFPQPSNEDNIEVIIGLFFDTMTLQTQPYEYLANAYVILGETFIKRPYERLHEEWLEGINQSLLSVKPQERYVTASQILQDEIDKSYLELQGQKNGLIPDHVINSIDFILSFGYSIATAAKNITLQYFSETLEYQPPILNKFEEKLQMSAIKQMCVFADELESSNDFEILKKMKCYLQEDLDLFKESPLNLNSFYTVIQELKTIMTFGILLLTKFTIFKIPK